MTSKLLEAFPPVFQSDAEVLVLGSMPGAISLERQSYYAHPRNLFWPFVECLFNSEEELTYLDRLSLVKANKIALWDVLAGCQREGSLDSNIQVKSEQPNDFEGILSQCLQLRRICFNGKKAESLFYKYIDPQCYKSYELVSLPSTSPANAAMSKELKYNRWSMALCS
ncbi:MAG: TDG/mug DNA glycosylase family protein [Flavobacteriales bacterium]|jgi:TDG/mug DNA glycosylase family protein